MFRVVNLFICGSVVSSVVLGIIIHHFSFSLLIVYLSQFSALLFEKNAQ